MSCRRTGAWVGEDEAIRRGTELKHSRKDDSPLPLSEPFTTFDASPTPTAAQPVTLPHLRHITMSGQAADRPGLASALCLPSLCELDIFYLPKYPYNEKQSGVLDFIQRFGPQLRSVSFDYAALTPEVLDRCLAGLPNVVTLRLTPYSVWYRREVLQYDQHYLQHKNEGGDDLKCGMLDDETIKKLTPNWSVDGSGGTLEGETDPCYCPKLEHVDFCVEEGAGDDTFVDFLVARSGCGVDWGQDEQRLRVGSVSKIKNATLSFYGRKKGEVSIEEGVRRQVGDEGMTDVGIRSIYGAPLGDDLVERIRSHGY